MSLDKLYKASNSGEGTKAEGGTEVFGVLSFLF